MKQLDRYRNVQAATSDPARLLLLLFDKTIAEVHKAQLALLDPEQHTQMVGCVMKAQLGVMELDRTLNYEPLPELAASLHNVYLHVLLLLGDVLQTPDLQKLRSVQHFLGELRDSFGQAAAQNTQEVKVG